MITLTYFQLFAVVVLAWIAGNALVRFIRYRKMRTVSFMNPEREEITDEMIQRQMKTLGKMFRKIPAEHRQPIAYVLELLKQDMNYQLVFFAAERKAKKENGG